eukprot:3084031-Pleurochrysis_carterae.AAC.3
MSNCCPGGAEVLGIESKRRSARCVCSHHLRGACPIGDWHHAGKVDDSGSCSENESESATEQNGGGGGGTSSSVGKVGPERAKQGKTERPKPYTAFVPRTVKRPPQKHDAKPRLLPNAVATKPAAAAASNGTP